MVMTVMAVCGMAVTARASLALEFDKYGIDTLNRDASVGWSFTTNSVVSVVGLDVIDATGAGAGNVRIYNALGTTLAEATVTNSDPNEGSPNRFHTVAISPLTLAADTTYYIAEDSIANSTIDGEQAESLTVDPSITYGGSVSVNGLGNNPTTDSIFGGGNNPGLFGPNFDIAAVPEPSMLPLGVTAVAAGVLCSGRRRKQQA